MSKMFISFVHSQPETVKLQILNDENLLATEPVDYIFLKRVYTQRPLVFIQLDYSPTSPQPPLNPSDSRASSGNRSCRSLNNF